MKVNMLNLLLSSGLKENVALYPGHHYSSISTKTPKPSQTEMKDYVYVYMFYF